MKVLHIVSEKTWRGGEQQVAYLIEELAKKNCQSFVVCRRGSEFEEYCAQNKIEYLALPFSSSICFKTIFGIKNFSYRVQADIVHTHAARAHSLAVYAALIGMKSILIVSKRTDFKIRDNYISRFKFNTPKVKKILTVSQKIKEIIDKDLIEDKSICVYSGIDKNKFVFEKPSLDLRKKLNLSVETKIIANTSALGDHKDYPTFIKVAKEFESQENLKFLIIGKGPLEDELKKLASSSRNIIFTGHLHNIEEIIPQLDVFLITSKEEGLGTSILDAMACKIPVVATAAGGIPEIVKHNQTGLLAPIGDTAKLVELVEQTFKNTNDTLNRVNNAYKMLCENFLKENTATKTHQIYKSFL